MKITGSEAVIKCLLEENVDLIYGYPGGAIMPIYDALYHYQKEVKHVLVRHEQGATHAAQGYAIVVNYVQSVLKIKPEYASSLLLPVIFQ